MATFDESRVAQLRRDCELNQIDLSRGHIETTGTGFVVRLDSPLVDITADAEIDGERPTRVECRSAQEAEGTLLLWCLRIQRAERKKVRVMRWHGDRTDLCRTPLDPGEVADYLAEQAHRQAVEKLRRELAAALAAKADKVVTAQQTAALVDRYGLAKPAKASPSKSKRATAQGESQ